MMVLFYSVMILIAVIALIKIILSIYTKGETELLDNMLKNNDINIDIYFKYKQKQK